MRHCSPKAKRVAPLLLRFLGVVRCTVGGKFVMACTDLLAGSLKAALWRGNACLTRFIHPVHQSAKLCMEVLERAKSGNGSSLPEAILDTFERCGLFHNLVDVDVELECLENGWKDAGEQREKRSEPL